MRQESRAATPPDQVPPTPLVLATAVVLPRVVSIIDDVSRMCVNIRQSSLMARSILLRPARRVVMRRRNYTRLRLPMQMDEK